VLKIISVLYALKCSGCQGEGVKRLMSYLIGGLENCDEGGLILP